MAGALTGLAQRKTKITLPKRKTRVGAQQLMKIDPSGRFSYLASQASTIFRLHPARLQLLICIAALLRETLEVSTKEVVRV